MKSFPGEMHRIEIYSEPIRTIPIHSDICIRANANYSEPIRKTFCTLRKLECQPKHFEGEEDYI